MIPASNLRIGNWVKTNDRNNAFPEGTGQVSSIMTDKIGVNGSSAFTPEEIHGIPLNHDMLLRAGFQQLLDRDAGEGRTFNDYQIHNDKGKIYISLGKNSYAQEGVYVFSGLGDAESQGFNASTKHVHELQNLYFALTGEELKIEQ